MKLLINGTPKGMGVDHQLVGDAANYYAELLMHEDSDRIDQIEVKINLIANLENEYGGVGFCHWTDDPLRPDKFLIELDSGLSHQTSLISLAHEMTHIKQMAFGHRQQSLCGKKMRWMGQLVDLGTTHYYDLPWEVEAHGREYGLYDRFILRNSTVQVDPATIRDNTAILKIIGLPG